jgi:hypothetical protein
VTEVIYCDTSALAKWYLNEDRSEEVEEFIRASGPVSVSTLTLVEMRSLLARRRRQRDLDAKMEIRIFATLEEDIRRGHLTCHPLEDGAAIGAARLISVLSEHPLRTLDALHLSIAQEIQATALATADRVMAKAAQALGLSVTRFD